MSEPIQHFLLIFDRAAGRLIRTEEFGTDSERAVEAYGATEDQYVDRADIEVVLIGSDSLDTVKLTHANYFGAPDSVSNLLAGI